MTAKSDQTGLSGQKTPKCPEELSEPTLTGESYQRKMSRRAVIK
jgi:hypothetical protein